jgi:hypothetical protein
VCVDQFEFDERGRSMSRVVLDGERDFAVAFGERDSRRRFVDAKRKGLSCVDK